MAFAALPVSDLADYDAIKTAVLIRYDINEDSYKNRFRSSKRKEGETNRVWCKDDGLVNQVAQGAQDGRPGSSGVGNRAVPELATCGKEVVAGGAEAEDMPSSWRVAR